MPTENERKYVLKLALNPITFSDRVRTAYEIQQGYLMASKGMSLRLRSSMETDMDMSKRFFMTYKCSTNGRVVEIEKKIDRRDFDDLWPQCMNKLIKMRYEYAHQQLVWEIDFFADHNGHNYFVMAEIELPEGVVQPPSLPRIISDNLVFEVPLTDCRFASKLLGDVRYAKELYEGLKK